MTKERIEISYMTKQSANVNSHIIGKVFDADGQVKIEIYGSWLDEIYLKDLETGEEELVFKEKPMLPEAHLQYFFGKEAVMMNYCNQNMVGVVAPTDSRWRKDL